MTSVQEIRTMVEQVFAASKYKRAAEAAGFEFAEPGVAWNFDTDSYLVRGIFKCVCGKHEAYSFLLQDRTANDCLAESLAFDPAYFLYISGSFGKEHLIQDGYTEEQAKQIHEKFNEAIR